MGVAPEAIVARAGGSAFADYDPRVVVDAVNVLVPLGKLGAIDAIEMHLSRADLERDPQEGLFLVLRVLFDVSPPRRHPPLNLGGSVPPPPPDASAMPRFPIVLVDDVPLLLVSGYALGGDTEPVSTHVEFYREHGRLRGAPLTPPPTSDGLLERYEAEYTSAYGSPPSQREIEFVDAQLSRM